MAKRGFTLIEILITISIVGIISAIGFVSYSSAQSSARDGKRKQDLRAIQTALEPYYQTNKTYPVTGNRWLYSNSATTPWVPELTTNYINILPKDPLRDDGDPLINGKLGYSYLTADTSSGCNLGNGQWYILITQLENSYDPEGYGAKQYKWCNNTLLLNAGNVPSGDYVIAYP